MTWFLVSYTIAISVLWFWQGARLHTDELKYLRKMKEEYDAYIMGVQPEITVVYRCDKRECKLKEDE